MSILKLHLACGTDYLDGYINVDLYPEKDTKIDAQFDVAKIPYEDNTIDEIRAFHIIEHFDFYEGQEVLKEWHRVLKPGGRIWLETPDFLASCKEFVDNPDRRIWLFGHLFSTPWKSGYTHKFLFTEEQLFCELNWVGFKNMKRLLPTSKYVTEENNFLFLNVEAYK